MNALVHRLIYNPSRGCMMAVAETASSASKAPSATSKARRKSSKLSKSARSDGFTPSKVPPTQWIRAQAAPDLIVICTVSTDLAASTVGAIGGNININAGQTFRQVGSDIIAPAGDINILAKKVDIVEARETSQTSTEQRFQQSALTLSIGSPVISAIQQGQAMAQAASQTSDGRMQALAAASTALNVYNNAKDIGDAATALASGDLKNAGSVNVSIGSSRSQSNTTSTSDTARGSTVGAGRNINITATGADKSAGQQSDILIQGSEVKAANNTTLTADNQVNLLAAKNEFSQTSTNSSSSSSIGASFSAQGISANASVSRGSGRSDGQDTSFSNTSISAGNTAIINSGGDTNVIGAVVSANTIKANIGGSLKVESLQDTSTFTSSQKSANASISVPITGGSFGGSVGASKSNVDSNFASVGQQSGLKAGDGGFQVDVAKNTALVGAVIASNQAALENTRNSFRTGGSLSITDIQNTASFKGSAVGGSVGFGDGKPTGSAGVGSTGGNASSTTTAGISGIAGNTAVRTGDAETGLQRIFDADKVQKEINAQVAITQAFGKEATKAGAQFAQDQLNKANGLKALADIETDPARKTALQQQANDIESDWKEGGTSRLLMHAAIGLLGGGLDGAIGAAASAAATPTLSQWLQDTQVSEPVRASILMVAGAAIGGLAGGTSGAAAGFNEVTNNGLGTVLKQVGVPALMLCLKTDSCRAMTGLTGAAIVLQAAQIMRDNPGMSESNAYTIAATDLSQYGLTGKPGAPLPGTGPTTLPGTAIATNNTTGGNQTSNPVGSNAGGGFGAGGAPTVDPLTYATSPIGSTSPVNTSQGAGVNVTTGSGSQVVVLPPGIDAKGAGHILIGDNPNSGGHLWPGQPGKTPFPQSWTPEKILGEIAGVANDPNSTRTPGRFGNTDVMGVRNGVQILVHVSPSGRVVSGYPINLPRNP